MIQIPANRHRQPWDEDDERLRELAAAEMSDHEIARRLGRTTIAVRKRAGKIDVDLRRA